MTHGFSRRSAVSASCAGQTVMGGCHSLCVLVVGALVFRSAVAQFDYFGMNKLQTREYNWQSYETRHFRVLFYAGGEALAEFAAASAEDYYRNLASDLGFEIDYKIPLLLYLSPAQFSETNVVTDVIEEGVGGFSELFKNRIVVPFTGSYRDLHHVIGHELAHIFEFQMFYRSRLSALLGAVGELQIPLWVMEGFAEFQSGWANVNSEIFMRDLVISDRLVSLIDLNDNYGYLAYREGESFFRYVEETYGRAKVYEFLHTLKNRRDLDATFSVVFGKKQQRVGGDWATWLKLRYWPDVGRQIAAGRAFDKLTDHVQDGSVYNTAPAISASGTKVALVTDRNDYVDCLVISTAGGDVLAHLVRGGRTGGFENLHIIRPGVAWSPDERTIAVVTTTAGLDNIALIEYPSGRLRQRIRGNMDGLYSPRFSPDGRRLAFVGLKNGFCDIYVTDLVGGEPERLTYDMYEERDPSFSPSGESLVFVSDRPDAGQTWRPGRYAVWLRDEAGRLTRLTEPRSMAGSPVFVPDGEHLLYTAMDSGQNVYVYSLTQGAVVGRTRALTEISFLTLSADGRKLAVSYYSNVGWDVAIMVDPLFNIAGGDACSEIPTDSLVFDKSGLDFDNVRSASFSLSLDYAAGAASYSAGSAAGLAGTINVALSDMLGNHRFAIYTDLYGDVLNSNASVQYWLLPFRTDLGVALFQYREYPYYNPFGPVPGIVERLNRGGQIAVSYPFNRFMRSELALTGYASELSWWRYDYSGPGAWRLYRQWWEHTFYGSAAFVLDNTYWISQGPVRGTRLRLETGSSFFSDSIYQIVYADVRNYQRAARRFVFATRFFGAGNFGSADRFYIGGENVRGYNRGEFYSQQGRGIGLLNLEWRFPFVDRLKLAFPLPLEITGVRGVAFADCGLVLRDSMSLWSRSAHRPQDIKVGVGAGLRVQISFFWVKLDFARPLSVTDDDAWKFVFGLGTDY